MIASLFALTVTHTQVLHLLGKLHPAVVHFPIALITIAAVLESLQLLRHKPALHAATPTCLVFGALTGIVAVVFGWFLEDAEGGGGDVVDWHKWVGIAAMAVAVLAALFLVRAAASDRVRIVLRATVFLGAALVGLTGYLGGELVFGKNHLWKGVFDKKHAPAVASNVPVPEPTKPDVPTTPAAVDFDHDIAPILRDYCLRCHGGEKTKGKLSLKTRADALKEAANGVSLVPGKPDMSTLYTRLVDTDPTDRMPPAKEKQLTDEQKQRVHQWIKDGAKWPEDAVLK